MTALLTQCPHCQTSFRVSTAQMNAAHGLVRCGSCLGVFSASAHEIRIRTPDGYLVEELEPDDDPEQSFSESSPETDSLAATIELPEEDLPLPIDAVTEVAAEQQDLADHAQTALIAPAFFADEVDDDALFIRVPSAAAPNPPTPEEYESEESYPKDSAIEEYATEEFEEPLPELDVLEEFDSDEPEPEQPEEAEPEEYEVEVNDGYSVADGTKDEPPSWHDDNDPVVTLGDMQLDDDYEDDDESSSMPEHAEEEYADEDSDDYADDEYSEDEEHEQDNYPAEPAYDEEPTEAHVNPEPLAVATVRQPPPISDTITAAPDKRGLHQRLSALTANDGFDPVDDDQLDALDTLPVTITQNDDMRGRLVQAALAVAALLLLLALPLPWLYAKRDTLASHPRFAFMAPLVCKFFTCAQQTNLDLASIYSQQLLVRSHPRYQDALEVSFIFRNDSTLPRPFPLVELAFSDLSNNLLANRLFKPQEYLPPELRQLSEMPAQSTVQVTLELQDPGKEAVNYTVKLHPPTP